MKPRYTPASNEAYEMLAKAQSLLEKAEELEKAKPCPKCGENVCKAGCGTHKADVQKGEHHKETTFDTRPGNVQFMSESGGQTFNAQYQTNQSLLDSDDVANKGASSSSVDMDMESSMRNPHDNINRLVEG
tara:strand:- start:258 stop:650 length:393 start_codon:yes stop_codon:yes gene_type:complete